MYFSIHTQQFENCPLDLQEDCDVISCADCTSGNKEISLDKAIRSCRYYDHSDKCGQCVCDPCFVTGK